MPVASGKAGVLVAATCLSLASLVVGYIAGLEQAASRTLEPREEVSIAEAELTFRARLDTGAVVSSINAKDISVIGGSGRPARSDVGKPIRFKLVNRHGEVVELTRPIEQVRGIRTADCREVRYHVYLTIGFRGKSRRILVNLNDRSRAQDKLLLGRNWLRQGYAVAPVKQAEL